MTTGDIARYIGDLRARPGRHGPGVIDLGSRAGLRLATMRRRLSAVRSWYAFLVGEEVVEKNPVPMGRFPRGRRGSGARGLLGRDGHVPWIPSREEWQRILRCAIADADGDPTRRNLTMLLVQYDGALRREELVQLRLTDVLPLADHTITVRAETTKSRRSRQVYYSPVTAALLAAYVDHRLRTAEQPEIPLFVSAGPRHRGGALSASSYTKVVEHLAARAAMPRLTTHTLRHLRLTHLALAEWDLHEIKAYAGHASIDSTLLYVHLGQPHVRAKYIASMGCLDAWVAEVMRDALRTERPPAIAARTDAVGGPVPVAPTADR